MRRFFAGSIHFDAFAPGVGGPGSIAGAYEGRLATSARTGVARRMGRGLSAQGRGGGCHVKRPKNSSSSSDVVRVEPAIGGHVWLARRGPGRYSSREPHRHAGASIARVPRARPRWFVHLRVRRRRAVVAPRESLQAPRPVGHCDTGQRCRHAPIGVPGAALSLDEPLRPAHDADIVPEAEAALASRSSSAEARRSSEPLRTSATGRRPVGQVGERLSPPGARVTASNTDGRAIRPRHPAACCRCRSRPVARTGSRVDRVGGDQVEPVAVRQSSSMGGTPG